MKMFIIESGKALYGDRWQTDLARDLGHSDGRRVRQWLNDERPIPDNIRIQIVNLLIERKKTIDNVLTVEE